MKRLAPPGWRVTHSVRDTEIMRPPCQLCSTDSDHMTEGIPAVLCWIFTEEAADEKAPNAHARDDCARSCDVIRVFSTHTSRADIVMTGNESETGTGNLFSGRFSATHK